MSIFTQGLNRSQKRVVLHNTGPLLVLAGAGSGKTRVLTMRVARLVKEKYCKPNEILAVTFTNKAAREMRERLETLLPKQSAKSMTISTFHSFGAKILRESGEAIGIKKNFTILDDHERTSTIKNIMRTSGRAMQKEKHDEFAASISLYKNGALKNQTDADNELFSIKKQKIYSAYQKVLLKRQCVDFDDLLLLPLKLFEQNKEVRKKYQQQFKFVCIDEYQDTNSVQMKLARYLAAPQNNIMVVGDDDQSIYSWRGANSQNIVTFSHTYPDCRTIILDVNYRSTRQILDGAHAVVAKNRVRKHKDISAACGDGAPIVHYRGDDEVDEAQWVAERIKEYVKNEEAHYCDQALLFRTNQMMRRFEEELRIARIPYRVSGAMSFFDRKEIKDILAYMRFFANPDDELSLLRVLKVPDRGITKTTIQKLDELAAGMRISLYQSFLHCEKAGQLIGSQKEKCLRFYAWCQDIEKMLKNGPPAAAIRHALESVKYRESLEKAYRDEPSLKERLENVDEMIHGLEVFERKKRGNNLALYLQDLALTISNEDKDNDSKQNTVTLMTIHKSKGLEFPFVYLVGLDDKVVPSRRSVEDGNMEEERRLFYVAMTRAKKQLLLTWPNTKVSRGTDIKVTPCRFIFEIPEQFLDGPIGEKSDAEYQEYVTDFFKDIKKQLSKTKKPSVKEKL